MKNLCLMFVLLLLLASGSKSKNAVVNSNGYIPIVDVRKEYPKSEICIQDIADVEYVPLETTKDFLCESTNVAYVDDSMIIWVNQRAGDILIFSRTGKALKRINRRGQSGEEYQGISNLAVDKQNNELYVNDMWRKKIFIYDINGNFKRSFSHLSGS